MVASELNEGYRSRCGRLSACTLCVEPGFDLVRERSDLLHFRACCAKDRDVVQEVQLPLSILEEDDDDEVTTNDCLARFDICIFCPCGTVDNLAGTEGINGAVAVVQQRELVLQCVEILRFLLPI